MGSGKEGNARTNAHTHTHNRTKGQPNTHARQTKETGQAVKVR